MSSLDFFFWARAQNMGLRFPRKSHIRIFRRLSFPHLGFWRKTSDIPKLKIRNSLSNGSKRTYFDFPDPPNIGVSQKAQNMGFRFPLRSHILSFPRLRIFPKNSKYEIPLVMRRKRPYFWIFPSSHNIGFPKKFKIWDFAVRRKPKI